MPRAPTTGSLWEEYSFKIGWASQTGWGENGKSDQVKVLSVKNVLDCREVRHAKALVSLLGLMLRRQHWTRSCRPTVHGNKVI